MVGDHNRSQRANTILKNNSGGTQQCYNNEESVVKNQEIVSSDFMNIAINDS